jgi:hypothetical protein
MVNLPAGYKTASLSVKGDTGSSACLIFTLKQTLH